jgi:hypothetical protein
MKTKRRKKNKGTELNRQGNERKEEEIKRYARKPTNEQKVIATVYRKRKACVSANWTFRMQG